MESEKDSPPPPPFDSPPRWEKHRRWRIPEHPLFHLALLLATFATTTIFGGAVFSTGGGPLRGGRFSDGFPFSIPAMTILGVHELAHYAVCRRYGLAATLPYFLPSPLSFGTFGALIRIKEPIPNKRVLLDVGAAGPLAGFVTALPFLFYGVSHARPVTQPMSPGTTLFGYPLIVQFAQDLTGTSRYTSATVHEHAMFMAAWFGMLVTAMNLLPIGQLDGAHVARAALAKRQPLAAFAAIGLALLTAFSGPPIWAIFCGLVALIMGIEHPPMPDDDEPLDFGRTLVALLCVAVFLLCFTPVPIRVIP